MTFKIRPRVCAICLSAVFVTHSLGQDALPADVAPKNLLFNGDFAEVEPHGPAHWNLDGKQHASVESSALKVDIVQNAGTNYGEIGQTIPVKPDTRYRVAGRIRSSSDRLAFIQVKRRRGRDEMERIVTDSSSPEWKEVCAFFNSGDADNVQVLCRYRQTAEHVGETAWFDDISLCEADVLPKEAVHEPAAVPTFHSVGLYWKPEEGAPDNACLVRYRKMGSTSWQDALPLWFDPSHHKGLAQHSEEYRGSIVNLTPGTQYEIALQLQKIGTTRRLRVQTWANEFPVRQTRNLAQPGTIKEGGSAEEGYVVYTADGVLDGGDERECVVKVDAPYVILRGLTIRGGRNHGVVINSHHVIVEDCDISGWGFVLEDGWGQNLNSAVYGNSAELEHIVIERCHLHDPRSDANSWQEPARTTQGSPSSHPIGPQGITLRQGKGRYVIRYNRITSDLEHMFNDGMGEVKNMSFAGFPNRDSDIYENFVSHCWDDGLELEGANMNVRVWRNATDMTMMSLAGATTSLGPIYIWRNISLRSRNGPSQDYQGYKGGGYVKLGQRYADYRKGRMYILHNTVFQPPPWPGQRDTSGVRSGLTITGSDYEQHNIVSRNNVLQCSNPKYAAINDPTKDPSNDFDWDLYVGKVRARDGTERHGIEAAPVYERGPDGRPWLQPGSPGHDKGQRLPNFNDNFKDVAPDMGAIETGDSEPLPSTWPQLGDRIGLP